jgi:hypothetical protein
LAPIVAVLSVFLILAILWDAFESIILPRRVTRRIRLTRIFYRSTWRPWSAIARRVRSSKRRETYLSYFGPISMLLLLSLWAFGLIVGFGLLHWAIGTVINAPERTPDLLTDLYLSGTTFFTLGFGDVTPRTLPGRALAVVESGLGFGFLALIIGYLPVLYQGFSRREASISLMDARAGSPSSAVELLGRYGSAGELESLTSLLHDLERWAAELLESHLSFPVLCFYRSQHDNQSWLAALVTTLDTCALVMVGVEETPAWQAELTFAMARHAAVDLAQVLNTPPAAPQPDRLPPADLEKLRGMLADRGVHLHDDDQSRAELTQLRAMYEPFVNALSRFLVMPLPSWIPARSVHNWRTSAWGQASKAVGRSAPVETGDDDHA